MRRQWLAVLVVAAVLVATAVVSGERTASSQVVLPRQQPATEVTVQPSPGRFVVGDTVRFTVALTSVTIVYRLQKVDVVGPFEVVIPPNPAPSTSCYQYGEFGVLALRTLTRAVTQCVIDVRATGAGSGTLTVLGQRFAATNVPPATVSVVPLESLPALTITPAEHNFGGVQLGTSADRSYTVTTNLGRAALSVSITPGDFTVAGSDCAFGSVVSGPRSCTVTVRFAPTAVGTRTATITVRDNQQNQAQARATGTGTERPPPPTTAPSTTLPPGPTLTFGLEIDPPAVDFGAVFLGVAAPARPATVRNTGNQPNAIASVTLGGPEAGEFSTGGCQGQTLAPGATCTLTLGFTPLAAGPRTATVTVSGSGGATAAAGLAGTGVQAGLAFEPESLDFGTSPVAVASAPGALVLRNVGSVAVTLATLGVEGPNAAEFAIASTDCTAGLVLAPGQACTVSVVATPADSGPRTAQVRATGDNAAEAAGALTVTGTFAPVLQMIPSVVPAGGVTTAVGRGFPRNSPVRVGFVDGQLQEVTTDANGEFRLPMLILKFELRGNRTVIVQDQPERFTGVQAPLLVTPTTFRPPSFATTGRPRLVFRG